MPIRAASIEGDVHAYAMTEGQWALLKASYKSVSLRMPCCDIAAIPKTSKLGNYFFAHARKGECATADESAEHVYCKTLIARAATDAGWTVTTERPGKTPSGEAWVADVFCERGTSKLALEVQMSPQNEQETLRRQARYRDSRVWGAWFFGAKARSGVTPFGKETPAFTLRPVIIGEVPGLEEFAVSLPEFVKGMLQKRLKWTAPEDNRPHYVQFFEDNCWSCKKPVKQVFDHLPGRQTPHGELLTAETINEGLWDLPAYTSPRLSDLLQALKDEVTDEELLAHGLNPIDAQDRFKGRPSKFPFCNLCRHCRAPQGNERIWERILASRRAHSRAYQDGMPEVDLTGEAPPIEGVLNYGLALIPRSRPGQGRWEFQEQDGGPA